MAFTDSNSKRIIELIQGIESRKEHSNAAPTYKDVSALQEIDKIVNEQLSNEETYDVDTVLDSIFAVRYLANSYESMWRIVYAVKYYNTLIKLHFDLHSRFGKKEDERSDDYYCALRARNYYNPDKCADLIELAKEFLSENKRNKIEKEVLEDYHPLKHDPVELTDEYLAVIDEIEKAMDTEEVKKLHPFQRNDLFQEMLRKRGIEWRSITEMNPNMLFN